MELKFDSRTGERQIVSYLVKNKPFYLKVGKFLVTNDYNKKSYFIDDKLQWILNISNLFYETYKVLPAPDKLQILAEKTFKDDNLLLNSMISCIGEIFSLQITDPEFLQDETIKFIKKARAVEATLLNQLDIQNGNYDELTDRMKEAVNINLDKDLGLSMKNVDATLTLIKELDAESGLTFGVQNIDSILGTPKSGELCVFCGISGSGKTIFLTNAAVENMKIGKKGVIFSLEVSQKRLARRIYSSLLLKSGVDILNTGLDEAKSIIDNIKGDIRIKNFQANSANCNDFAAYLDELYTIEGYKPDFIVIDYILITATNSTKMDSSNSYAYYKRVAEEMRNLAVQYNCPVFTASQINRDGMSSSGGSKDLVTGKNISESKGIIDTADYLLIINQTVNEKKNGTYRLYVDKNRNGNNGEIINIDIDYTTMTMKEGKKETKF